MGLAELAVLLLVLLVAHLAAGEDGPGKGADPVGVTVLDAESAVLRTAGHRMDRSPAASCVAANKTIGHYRKAYTRSRNLMGLTGAVPRVWYHDCKVVQRRALEWRDKAEKARRLADGWVWYQYAWREWLPRGWYGIGSCETGYGGDPNWRHNSGAYQGAFGFAVSSWDGFVGSADPKAGPYPSEAYLATPRQQYEVALAIYRRYGLSGWGCRGAFYR